jgi:SHOCT-like protein
MKEEIMRILKMVEDGKISADKGAQLIEAINKIEEKNEINNDNVPVIALDDEASKAFPGEKMIKIRVLSHEGDKVNITVPIKFVKSMINATGKIPNINVENMDGVNTEEITDTVMAAIDNGMVGKIVDIESHEGDIVEITIE